LRVFIGGERVNIPNVLTGLRLLIIPSFGYYLYIGNYKVAVFLFLISGFTDVLDGFIARKFNMVTSWGKLADPLADKLMQITALVILTFQKNVPIFVLAIVMIKEILMGIGSIVLLKQKKYVVSANWYGKIATILFYFAIIAIIVKIPYSNYFIIIALAATLFAFFKYSISYVNIKKRQ
jgi:cardiolipin synthase